MTEVITKEQARAIARSCNFNAELMADKLKDVFKDFLQEALEAEMDDELGYSKYDWKNKVSQNSRNGHSKNRNNKLKSLDKKGVSAKNVTLPVTLPKNLLIHSLNFF